MDIDRSSIQRCRTICRNVPCYGRAIRATFFYTQNFWGHGEGHRIGVIPTSLHSQRVITHGFKHCSGLIRHTIDIECTVESCDGNLFAIDSIVFHTAQFRNNGYLIGIGVSIRANYLQLMNADCVVCGIAGIVFTVYENGEGIGIKFKFERFSVLHRRNGRAVFPQGKLKQLFIPVYANYSHSMMANLSVQSTVGILFAINSQYRSRSSLDSNTSEDNGIILNTVNERINCDGERLRVSTVSINNELIVSHSFDLGALNVRATVQCHSHPRTKNSWLEGLRITISQVFNDRFKCKRNCVDISVGSVDSQGVGANGCNRHIQVNLHTVQFNCSTVDNR